MSIEESRRRQLYVATAKRFKELREQTDRVLVAYSGGKDSRCVLDLACKTFDHVICYTCYFVPGISQFEKSMQFARDRYRVEILYYPGIGLMSGLQYGAFCQAYPKFADLPKFGPYDMTRIAMRDTNMPICLNGERREDSIARFRRCGTWEHEGIISPISDWTKFDVFGYLKFHDIPIPDSDMRVMTGINLSIESVLWLYDKHREDYEQMRKMFPYISAHVKRREWYGVTGVTKNAALEAALAEQAQRIEEAKDKDFTP